jgi:hypothetical protein
LLGSRALDRLRGAGERPAPQHRPWRFSPSGPSSARNALATAPQRIDWYPKLFGTCDAHGKHCHQGKRNVTFHFTKHVTSPYGQPESGDDVTGSYEADIDWTAKFHRVTKAHTGR